MNSTTSLLLKTLVKPFYRQNAGQFIFIFIIFFGAVGEVGGYRKYTGPIPQLHYQYALITGMLNIPLLLVLVFLVWLIYAEKCAQYVLAALQRPDHSFLHLLNDLSACRRYRLLYFIQCMLYLPVIIYLFAIAGIAIYNHFLGLLVLICAFVVLVCALTAARFFYLLEYPGRSPLLFWPRLKVPFLSRGNLYWQFLLRYVLREHKLMMIGIKLFSCGIFYETIRAIATDNYDIRMPVLWYGLGILAHGVLIYRLRDMEQTRLLFYRGIPVSITQRMVQYGLFYALLLVPEMITIGLLSGHPLHYSDALAVGLCAYGLLLLLNSILYIAPIPIKDYLKIVLGIFLVLYFSVLAGMLLWLAVVLLVMAITLFRLFYYRYEDNAK
jgi:hypothetical protein